MRVQRISRVWFTLLLLSKRRSLVKGIGVGSSALGSPIASLGVGDRGVVRSFQRLEVKGVKDNASILGPFQELDPRACDLHRLGQLGLLGHLPLSPGFGRNLLRLGYLICRAFLPLFYLGLTGS